MFMAWRLWRSAVKALWSDVKRNCERIEDYMKNRPWKQRRRLTLCLEDARKTAYNDASIGRVFERKRKIHIEANFRIRFKKRWTIFLVDFMFLNNISTMTTLYGIRNLGKEPRNQWIIQHRMVKFRMYNNNITIEWSGDTRPYRQTYIGYLQ